MNEVHVHGCIRESYQRHEHDNLGPPRDVQSKALVGVLGGRGAYESLEQIRRLRIKLNLEILNIVVPVNIC